MYCVGVMTKTRKDVGELMSAKCEKQKAINSAYLRKVFNNVIFLQGGDYQGGKFDIS